MTRRASAPDGPDSLREVFEELYTPSELTGPVGDAWRIYVSEVNWREIAAAYAEDEA